MTISDHLAESELGMLREGIKDHAFYLLDAQGHLRTWNPGATNLLGYSSEEILGTHFSRLFTPADVEAGTPSHALRTAREEGVYQGEGWRVRKDGTRFWAAMTITPLPYGKDHGEGFVVLLNDHTAQRRAEEELRRLTAAVEAAANGVVITDLDGHIRWVNPAFTSLTGYGREEALGQHTRILKSGRHPREFYAQLWETVTAGKVWRGEVWNKRKDGRLYCEEMTITPQLDQAGKISNFIAIKSDVTAKKEAQDALRASQERLAGVVNSAMDGIISVDEEQRILLFNAGAERIFGYRSEEVVGQPLLFLMPERFRGHHHKLLQGFGSGETYLGGGVCTAIRGLRRSGEEFQMEATVSVVAVMGKRIFTAIIRDVTESQKLLEELRQSRQRFRAIFDQSFQFIGLLTADGILLEANRTALDFAGATLEEVQYRPFWETPWWRHSPELQERLRQAIREAAQGRFIRFEVTHPDPNNNLHQIDFSLKPVCDAGGAAVLLIAEGRDITEFRLMQERMLQAQKMEAMGILAGGIAHEFNNLLTSVLGYADLANQLTKGDPRATDALQCIIKAGRLAQSLVAQILAFSRKDPAQVQVLDLKPLVAQAVKFLRASIPSTISMAISEPEGPLPVRGNPTRLNQVVMNLATNAYQAMPRGGVLTVDLARVQAASGTPTAPGQACARLTITDTGVGINPALHSRIFDPFFTTKGVGEGTGLGLSVVHGIVQEHGGHIDFKSEIGSGSRFDVYLPLAELVPNGAPPEGPAARQMPMARPLAGKRILFVDDDTNLAQLGQRLLEQWGWEVEPFSNPHEALHRLTERPGAYACLVTDLTMPGLTGLQLTEHARSLAESLPVIVMTGYFENRQLDEECLQLGVATILRKPFLPDDMAKALRAVPGLTQE